MAESQSVPTFMDASSSMTNFNVLSRKNSYPGCGKLVVDTNLHKADVDKVSPRDKWTKSYIPPPHGKMGSPPPKRRCKEWKPLQEVDGNKVFVSRPCRPKILFKTNKGLAHKRALRERYEEKLRKLEALRERELLVGAFERLRLNASKQRRKNELHYTPQSGFDFGLSEAIHNDFVLKLAEDLMLMVYHLRRAETLMDYVVAGLTFFKARSQESLVKMAVKSKFIEFVQSFVLASGSEPEEQSGEELELEQLLRTGRETLDLWPRMKSCALTRKINRVVMFAASIHLFGDEEISGEKVLRLEKEFSTTRNVATIDLTHSILDLILFVVERGYQVFKTGRMDVMFHSGATYEEWYDKAQDIIAKSKFLCNPEAHGIDVHAYINDLDKMIAKGQSMARYAAELDKFTLKSIQTLTMKLREVRAEFVNRRSARETRRAPFCLVIEGGTSVGKTTFSNMMHSYYANLCRKRADYTNRYTRCSTSEYWDGYTTDQWSLLMDDVACFKPGAINGVDPTVAEILYVNNNAPAVPNMAALESKGAAPLKFEFVCITTNNPGLNLNFYYNVPIAPARRFPFHILLEPKQEYSNGDGMLLKDDLDESEIGSYPDWWNITVKSPEKCDEPGKNKSQSVNFVLKTVKKFDNIGDYLTWLAQEIHTHNDTQGKVTQTARNLVITPLCLSCHLPHSLCRCVDSEFAEPILDQWEFQSGVELSWLAYFALGTGSFVFATLMETIVTWIKWTLYRWFLNRWLTNYWPYIRATLESYTFNEVYKTMVAKWEGTFDYVREKIRNLGDKVRRHLKTPAVCFTIAGALAIGVVAYQVCSHLQKPKQKEQGGISSTLGTPPDDKNERESVWKKADYEVSSFDAGRKTLSWKGLTVAEVQRILFKNVFFLKVWDGQKWKVTNILGLGGHKFVTTKHSIPEFEEYATCKVIRSPNENCATGNIQFRLTKSQLCPIEDTDLVVLTILNVPPVRDLTELFVSEKETTFRGKGFYLIRETKGNMTTVEVGGIACGPFSYHKIPKPYKAWTGKPLSPTKEGDCGAPMVIMTPSGPAIVGIHQLAISSLVGYAGVLAIGITREMVSGWLEKDKIVHPGAPELSAPSAPQELVDLHENSPVRYLQSGTIEVFGSFTGFRQQPKSRVRRTLLCDAMEERGYKLTHGAPVMKGWRPWSNAITALTKQSALFREDILRECAAQFLAEWKTIDPKWLKELRVLDDFTTVNGKAGVRYIDGINKSTSAGFPWKKSKKHFLEFLPPQNGFLSPVMFNSEIMDRVDGILRKYQNGERAYPVFVGSLKDEARKRSKIEAAKTRMFMGGPVDFIFVMRKFLLTFSRVMQKNKWVFECAVGMECQSVEWDLLFQFLTQFDEGDIIHKFEIRTKAAGDYEGFDTIPDAVLMLVIGEMITDFHQYAGWIEDMLRFLRCIFTDLAFAVVEINGDLVMFIGRNPSGQAMTSPMNSIANCLIIRYCYRILNPDKEVRTFKKNVALITYGDDNGFGVISKVSWFNHTAVMKVLAEIGVKFTMAEKDAESVPFISMKEVTFLKRSFRFEEETQTVMAPLAEESIIKSLMIGVASTTVGQEAQMVDTIYSANSEWFFHGREVFEEKRKMLLDLIEEHDLGLYMNRPLETWDELMVRYKRNSLDYLAEEDLPSWAKTDHYRLDLPDDIQLQAGAESSPPPEPTCGRCSQTNCPFMNYEDPDDLRICTMCHHCRFDDYDVDCLHCGRNDCCECCSFIGPTVRPRNGVMDQRGYLPHICDQCVPLMVTRLRNLVSFHEQSGFLPLGFEERLPEELRGPPICDCSFSGDITSCTQFHLAIERIYSTLIFDVCVILTVVFCTILFGVFSVMDRRFDLCIVYLLSCLTFLAWLPFASNFFISALFLCWASFRVGYRRGTMSHALRRA